MCGIFALLSSSTISTELAAELDDLARKLKHRGPDNYSAKLLDDKVFLGFHRLCIVDTSAKGDQPLFFHEDESVYLICNGEIYNHQKLTDAYDFKTYGHSDCEVILHMYRKFGIKATLKALDGVFAFVLYDRTRQEVYVARDPFGVRSQFLGRDDNGNVWVSSELKAIPDRVTRVKQFPPGCCWELSTGVFKRFYDYSFTRVPFRREQDVMEAISVALRKAVEKRLMSDRPIGCLLSGGLDSSLVAALVAKHFPRGHLQTFSIGLKGSPDLKYAKLVADHIGSTHHEIITTAQQMLDALPDVIRQIETYDTTTVRSSTPLFLLSKYIKERTDIVVVYAGEGSDEASGSYMYFKNAPSAEAFDAECVRLLKDLHYFDVLRGDKGTASSGLEVRVPFLDQAFIRVYMGIAPHMKQPRNGVEKYLLRKAFDTDENLLPKEVLWRKKEAFSDGVSTTEDSWYEMVKRFGEESVTDQEFETMKKYPHNPPKTKEECFNRRTFDQAYPGREHTVPYFWLPRWCGEVVDPSARILDVYYD